MWGTLKQYRNPSNSPGEISWDCSCLLWPVFFDLQGQAICLVACLSQPITVKAHLFGLNEEANLCTPDGSQSCQKITNCESRYMVSEVRLINPSSKSLLISYGPPISKAMIFIHSTIYIHITIPVQAVGWCFIVCLGISWSFNSISWSFLSILWSFVSIFQHFSASL